MLGGGLSIPEVAERPRLDPAAAALIGRMTSPPGGARAGEIDRLVRALREAGLWGKLHALYLLAAHDAQAARLNWVQDSYNLTAVSSPAFTADRGYAGDGSGAYLDTGWAPSLGAQDSLCVGAWSRSEGQSNVAIVGTGTTNSLSLAPRSTLDQLVSRINSTTTNSYAGAASGVGWFTVNRSGPSATQSYRGGASVGTGSNASAAPASSSLCIGRFNSSQYSSRQIAAAVIAASLDASEQAALFAALTSYLAAVGAA